MCVEIYNISKKIERENAPYSEWHLETEKGKKKKNSHEADE